MSLNIGLDVDGVLASFESGFRHKLYAVRKVEGVLTLTHHHITNWDYPQVQFGYTHQEVDQAWGMVKTDPHFWSSLDPHEDTLDFLSNLGKLTRRHDHQVYFITHRMGLRARRQTETWLRMVGWDHERPTVLLSGTKGAVCRALGVDIYVDDKNENVREVSEISPSTRGFMLARPWNSPQSGVPRLTRLGEFYQAVDDLTHKDRVAT